MRITSALFKIAEKNNLMSEAELDGVKADAEKWFKEKQASSKIAKWISETEQLWYVRLIVAYLFVFFNRTIWDYMHPEENGDDDDD